MLLLALLACAKTADPGVWTLPADAPLPLDAAREAEVDRLLAELTLEEKLDLLAGTSLIPQSTGWPTAGVPRLDVPGFRMTDGPRGVGLAPVATVFPVGVARAASWDPDVEEAVMASIAREAAAAGKDTLLAPTLNLVTHPAWGRAQESYGEEPLLLGAMAAGGLQGASSYILTTAKHFAVNNIEATRYLVDAQVDDRTLREVYLPHFRMAVRQGGADWVMAAYNQVNGHYAAENPTLLTEVLKGEWGFQGAVMTDWIWGLDDGVAGLNAGLDLEMPIPDKTVAVAAAVADGTIPMSRLDDAARRQLRLALARADHAAPDPTWQRAPEHFQIAREAARRGTVLLQNDGLLPLDPAGTVAVVGLLADVANTGDRGSSNVPYADVITPLAGLVARLGEAVTSVPTDTPDAGQLAAIAAADAAVVVVGLDWQDEGECITSGNACDREVLTLDPTQEALIAAVVAANPDTVVILEGGAAIVTEAWVDAVPAVMMAWYPRPGGRPRPDRAAARRRQPHRPPARRLPPLGRPAPAVRPGQPHRRLRAAARLAVDGARRRGPAVPVRARPQLHRVRPDRRRRAAVRRSRRADRGRRGGGQRRRARRRHRRPGLPAPRGAVGRAPRPDPRRVPGRAARRRRRRGRHRRGRPALARVVAGRVGRRAGALDDRGRLFVDRRARHRPPGDPRAVTAGDPPTSPS
jgi:beta-glucosidase